MKLAKHLFLPLLLLLLFDVKRFAFSQNDDDNAFAMHKEAKKISETEACPHLMDTSKKKRLQLMELNGIRRLCCGCDRGQKLVGLCEKNLFNTTRCEDCPTGTYMTQFAHGNTKCIEDNLKCPDNDRYSYIPSSRTSKPECHCRLDKSLYKASDGTCRPHSKCPPGQGVHQLGTQFSDTVCSDCDSNHESPSLSATERCKLKQRILQHPQNKIIETLTTRIETTTLTDKTSAVATQPDDRASNNGDAFNRNLVIIVLIGLLFVCWLAGVVGIVFVRKRKKNDIQNPVKSSTTESMEPDLLSNKDDGIAMESIKTDREKNRFLEDVGARDQMTDSNLTNCVLHEMAKTVLKIKEHVSSISTVMSFNDWTNHTDDAPTSSRNALICDNLHNCHQSDEDNLGGRDDADDTLEAKVRKYFLEVSQSPDYVFCKSDVSSFATQFGIVARTNQNSDSFGFQMYQVVRDGLGSNKISPLDVLQYFRNTELKLIVEQLEKLFPMPQLVDEIFFSRS